MQGQGFEGTTKESVYSLKQQNVIHFLFFKAYRRSNCRGHGLQDWSKWCGQCKTFIRSRQSTTYKSLEQVQ